MSTEGGSAKFNSAEHMSGMVRLRMLGGHQAVLSVINSALAELRRSGMPERKLKRYYVDAMARARIVDEQVSRANGKAP